MLYSRAGTYPAGAAHLAAEAFSPNTAAGACPECHGLGVTHDVAEDLMVPDPSLTIREGAIASWPGAWQGNNLRASSPPSASTSTGRGATSRTEDREWLLFTDEQPTVLIEPERDRDRPRLPRHVLERPRSTSSTSWPTRRAR